MFTSRARRSLPFVPLALLFVATLSVGARAQDRYSSTHFHSHPAPAPGGAPGVDETVDSDSPARALRARYHDGATLFCVDCHDTHAPAARPATAAKGAIRLASTNAPATTLRGDDPLATCLSCHDGKPGIPDVIGDDVNHLASRSAGFFEEPGRRNPRGHDLAFGLAGQAGTAELCSRCHPSSNRMAGVTCVDCHDPHGNGRARSLRYASEPAGTPPLGLLVNPGATGLERYESANVAFGTLDSDQLREVSAICVDCHHTLSGASHVDPNGAGVHVLHPTYDSEHGSRNSIRQGGARGTSAPDHWQRGVGSGFVGTERVRFVTSGAADFATARQVNPATNGVFCLSCHRAHGSSEPFGLVWPATRGSGPAGCDQCHQSTEVADLGDH